MEEEEDGSIEGRNTEAYLEQMVRLLKVDGVTFKGNKIGHFAQIEPLWKSGLDLAWHAEGWWEGEEVMRKAGRTYEELVVAGFRCTKPSSGRTSTRAWKDS